MRSSKALRIMREGGVAISTKCNLDDPRSAMIVAASGFDCVWIDPEPLAELEEICALYR